MDKRERVRAALEGKSVDRIPVAAWGHFLPEEHSHADFAEATLRDFRKYDWDFIKINNRATLFDEAWGNRYDPRDRLAVFPRRVSQIAHGEDIFAKIERLDVSSGIFGEYIREAVKPIVAGANGAPVIQTVFSPLSVLGFILSDSDDTRIPAIRSFIARDPVAVRRVLDTIALTLADFSRETLRVGADGIFFAIVQIARQGAFTEAEYREFGIPYDLKVLRAVDNAPFNLLHICGNGVYFDVTREYPVHAINYDPHGKGNLSLSEARSHTAKTIVGGIQQEEVLVTGTPFDVAAEAKKAIAVAGRQKFILSPGCSVNFAKIPEANLRALRNAVE